MDLFKKGPFGFCTGQECLLGVVSAGDAGGENSPLRSFLLNQACDGFVCFLAALGDLGCEREVLGAGFEKFKMFFF